MKKNYLVERMEKDEVNIAIDWAANEGWNPGLHDAECFYQADPHGFFAGKLNGKIIAVGS
ncbi:GNAT family N-acetyltransferase, partial [Legionella sp. 29fVS95]